MSYDEFQSWLEFFDLFPFDDYHRFYRPAALVAGAMSGDGEAMHARLEWMQPDPKLRGLNEVERSILRAFGG